MSKQTTWKLKKKEDSNCWKNQEKLHGKGNLFSVGKGNKGVKRDIV